MRDNLIFFNSEETERENTTSVIHKILEENMGFEDASKKIKTTTYCSKCEITTYCSKIQLPLGQRRYSTQREQTQRFQRRSIEFEGNYLRITRKQRKTASKQKWLKISYLMRKKRNQNRAEFKTPLPYGQAE